MSRKPSELENKLFEHLEEFIFRPAAPLVILLAAVILSITLGLVISGTGNKILAILTVWVGAAGVGALNWAIMHALLARPYVRITRVHADMCNEQTSVKISVDVKNFGSVDAQDLRISLANQAKSKSLCSLFPGEQRDKIEIAEVRVKELVSPDAESRDLIIDLVYDYAGRLRRYQGGERVLLRAPDYRRAERREQTCADGPQP